MNESVTNEDLLKDQPSISVLSWNIDGRMKYGFEKRKEAAVEIFKEEFDKGKSEIVGFQELAVYNWELLGKVRPDLELVPGKVAEDVSLNAFAYNKKRFKLIEHDTIWLTPDRKRGKGWDAIFERALTWGILEDLQNHRRFLFQNIHPDNVSAPAREESTKILLGQADEYKLPTIVTADSNVSVHSPDRKRWSDPKLCAPYTMMINAGFKDAWCEAHPGEVRPCTFHQERGPRYNPLRHDGYGTYDTDWVMYRGPFRTDQAWTVQDRYKQVYPSDHYGVRAVLVWTS